MAVVLFGGAFDPPHVGHVAVARAARERFDPERFIVLVSESPGHKEVHSPVETRLELARAAFPDAEVRLTHTGDAPRFYHLDSSNDAKTTEPTV